MKNCHIIHRFLIVVLLPIICPVLLSAQGNTCAEALSITPGTIQSDGPDQGNGCYNCSPGVPGGIPAVHADWFTYTPDENGTITIASCNQGVDTRLWIYTGRCDSLVLYAHNDDDCDMLPNELYAARIENLAVEAGVAYYIEWDDAWDRSGFSFQFIFESIQKNARVRPYPIHLTQLPLSQTINGIDLKATVENRGAEFIGGISVTTQVIDSSQPASPVFENQVGPFDLGINADTTVDMGSWIPADTAYYAVVNSIQIPGGDDDSTDNMARSFPFQISDCTYALDDGDLIGGLGINGPGSISQGQVFKFPERDTIYGVDVNIDGGNPGDSIWLEIWEVDPQSNVPLTRLEISKKFTISPPDGVFVQFPLNRPFEVEAGSRYFFSFNHQATGNALNVGVTENIFQPQNAFVSIQSQPWIPLESLTDPSGNPFRLTYALRLKNKIQPEKSLKITVDMQNEQVSQGVAFIRYQLNGGPFYNIPMLRDSNDIYSSVFTLPAFTTINYLFYNGNPAGAGIAEEVPPECSIINDDGLSLRQITLGATDLAVQSVCFGGCSACPPPPCARPEMLICDDIEFYTPGPVGPQSNHWDTWDDTAGDGIVTRAIANSGIQSLAIEGASSSGGPQDVLLLLGVQDSGRYSLSWQLFIPENRASYFNIQHELTPVHIWGIDVYFDTDATGEIRSGLELLHKFTYQQNTWIEVELEIDIDNDEAHLSIDGNRIGDWAFSLATDVNGDPLPANAALAALNFYPIDQTYKYYLDDVYFEKLPPVQKLIHGTFTVDMSRFIDLGGNISNQGMQLAGNFSNGTRLDMTQTSNDLWTFNGLFPVDSLLQYNFYNGPNIEYSINLSDCGISDTLSGFFRIFSTGQSDFIADTVCYEYCISCNELVRVSEPVASDVVEIFPNPTAQQIGIFFKNEHPPFIQSVRLIAANGQTIKNWAVQQNIATMELDISALQSGIYTLKIFTAKEVLSRSVAIIK